MTDEAIVETDDALAGETLAVTGRLASMSRRQAIDLIQRHGSRYTRSVNRTTTMLLVGADGWPLDEQGRITRKLRAARQRRFSDRPVAIVSEEQFLTLIGADEQTEIRTHATAAELVRLIGINSTTLSAWVRNGLITPDRCSAGVDLYRFEDVQRLRSLASLLEQGVTARRLRRSLGQLARWAPQLANVSHITTLEHSSQLVSRTADDRKCLTNGQLLFEFPETGVEQPSAVAGRIEPDLVETLFDSAVAAELREDWPAAITAYENLLAQESDEDAAFNLANCLRRVGRTEEAIASFRLAVHMCPDFAEGWNNLGDALAELGRHESAVRAFRRTLAIDPQFADAWYNLADVLEATGRDAEAADCWRTYLRFDAESPWADHARERIDAGA